MSFKHLQTILNLLNGVKPLKDGSYQAICPAHDDHNPSLSIGIGRDERVLLHCFAGCELEKILRAMGITEKVLFSQPSHNGQSKRLNTLKGKKPKSKTNKSSDTAKTFVCPHDYTDEAGAPLFQVRRFSDKSFSQHKSDGNGNWMDKLYDARRVLYQLPQLVDVPASSFIYICEGEKDADRLISEGLYATTCSGGAGKWKITDDTPLHDHHVIILEDNDSSGRKHALDVATRLHSKAKSVRILALPGLSEKGDVSDWLDAGNNFEELDQLANIAPKWSENDISQDASVSLGQTESWGKPVSLTNTPIAPAFPIEAAFPSSLFRVRNYIKAVAESLQVPIDLPAMALLPIVSVSIAKKMEIELRPDWFEPAAIWTMTLMASGERKSAAYKCMQNPLSTWEKDKAAELKPKIARQQQDRKELEAQLTYLTRNLARKVNTQAKEKASELAEQISAMDIISAPQLTTSEPTTEAVAGLLVDNIERLLVISAEADALDVMLGRYSKSGEGNYGVWLSGHSGDPYRVDRRGRESDHLERPALSIALAIQPDSIEKLFSSKQAKGRGVIARFLKCAPKSLLGSRKTKTKTIAKDLKDLYGKAIHNLLEFQTEDTPLILKLSKEAQSLFDSFRAKIELDLGEQGELCNHAAWASKLPGAIARIALALHCLAEIGLMGDSVHCARIIDADTMRAALSWVPYLIDHEKIVNGMATIMPEAVIARRILNWIAKYEKESFSRRDVYTACRVSDLKRAIDIDPPLELLKELGYIKPAPTPSSVKPGRDPSIEFNVNPLWDREVC